MNKIIWENKGNTRFLLKEPDVLVLPAKLCDTPPEFFDGVDLFVICDPRFCQGKYFSCSFGGYDARSIVVQDHYIPAKAAEGKKRIFFRHQLSYITKITGDINIRSWNTEGHGMDRREYWGAFNAVTELTRMAIADFDRYFPIQRPQ